MDSFPLITLLPVSVNLADSLDPDQAGHEVGTDLATNCLTLIIFLKEFYKKVDFEKNQQMTKKHEKLPRRQMIFQNFINTT